jgi:arsenite-transporting ATPase
MAPRTILYTGKGGVGKTSVAAATARRCAAAGLTTVVMSTDPAHSLGDALEASLGASAEQVGDRLWAQQVSAQDELEHNWSAVQEWLGEMLVERGVDRISAEELTVPPGMDELFSLLALKRHHDADEFDVVVVDCAPTGETLRLLSFPDVAQWWLDKVFPQRTTLAKEIPALIELDANRVEPRSRVAIQVALSMKHVFLIHELLDSPENTFVRLFVRNGTSSSIPASNGPPSIRTETGMRLQST